MKFLNKLDANIPTLLVIIFSTIILTVITVSYIIFSDWNKRLLEENINNSTNLLLDNVEKLLVYPLSVGDVVAVKSVINSQLNYDNIYSISVYDENNNMVTSVENYKVEGRYQSEIHTRTIRQISLAELNEIADLSNSQPIIGSIKVATKFIAPRTAASVLIAEYPAILFGLVIFIVVIVSLIIYKVKMSISFLRNGLEKVESGEVIEDYSPCFIREVNEVFESIKVISKELVDRKQHSDENFNKAMADRKTAEEALTYKESFIRTLSHDLRTPSGVIKGFTDILSLELTAGSIVTKQHSEYLHFCSAAVDQLNSIVEDLFAYERFEKESVEILNERFELEDLRNRLYSANVKRFEDKGIVLSVKNFVSPGTCQMKADLNKLVRVYENLIDNSLKFTASGSVTVTLNITDNFLVFTIKDSGRGIDQERIPYIFGKHYSYSESNETNGLGLGLYYVDTIVKILGGHISLSSMKGIGTQIEVKVPIEVSPVEEITQISKVIESNLHAFIIDDRIDNCVLLAGILERMGITTESYQIPELGYRAVTKAEHLDVIFIDYHMDDIDGILLARKIQSNPQITNHVPIVCVTADVSEKTITELITSGVFESILTKPIKIEQLKSLLQSITVSRKLPNEFKTE